MYGVWGKWPTLDSNLCSHGHLGRIGTAPITHCATAPSPCVIILSLPPLTQVHLVMAGGYDSRVLENVEHHKELRALCRSLGLEAHLTFVRSFSDMQKVNLLRQCACVLYTPANEHFGIVPVEAMYCRCPVVAVNSGGPLESVAHEETGFLCPPSPESFSAAMERFVREPELKGVMGEAGRERVINCFSLQAFTEQLHRHILSLTTQ